MNAGTDRCQDGRTGGGGLDAGGDAHRKSGDIGFDLPPEDSLRSATDDGEASHLEARGAHRLENVAQGEGAAFEQRSRHMRLAVRQREAVKHAPGGTIPFGSHRTLHAG